MKKGQIAVNVIIGMGITLIIGVIVLSIIWTQYADQVGSATITGDQFTASNTTCVELTDKCLTSITSLNNATGNSTMKSTIIGSGNYSICTARGLNNKFDGVLLDGDTVVDAGYNGQTVNASYTEISCNRITGMTATIVGYLPVLLAIVLLIFLAGFIAIK